MSDRTLICLDLNGTIMCRRRHSRTYIPRPHLNTFLTYAFRDYDVGIWSSGKRRNMDPLVRRLFGDFYYQLKFTYYRDMCEHAPTEAEPWATAKDISRIPMNYRSVIMIDDTAEKIKGLSPDDHHYEIPPYHGSENDAELQCLTNFILIRKLDEALRDLGDVLEKIEQAEGVSG